MTTVKADAEVQITVALKDLGSWGEDCGLGQIFRQAKEMAIHNIRNHPLFSEHDVVFGDIAIKVSRKK